MVAKFGITEKELTYYQQLLLMPETDENGFYDESIDVKITQLKRLRLRSLQAQKKNKSIVENEENKK